MATAKLYQCPYEKATKCSQEEPCNGCETWAAAAKKPQVFTSNSSDLLCCQMFETYNDKLCHAISALAKHHTTQNPIPDDDYLKIHNLLMDIRLDIHNSKAT